MSECLLSGRRLDAAEKDVFLLVNIETKMSQIELASW